MKPQSSLLTNDTAFALSSSHGYFGECNSSIKSREVAGFGIIKVISAPVILSLVYASTATIFYLSLCQPMGC